MAPHLFSLPLGRRLRQHYENGGPWLACLLPIRGRRRCVDDVLNKGGGEGGGSAASPPSSAPTSPSYRRGKRRQ